MFDNNFGKCGPIFFLNTVYNTGISRYHDLQSSNQPDHPSVSRRNEYQRTKQAHHLKH